MQRETVSRVDKTSLVFQVLAGALFAWNLNAADLSDALATPLLDETGNTTTISEYDGFVRLVFFGYTNCPDICPLTLYRVGGALRLLDGLGEDVRVLFVSVDPKRDTPDVLAVYTDSFHPNITGITGGMTELSLLAQRFRTSFGYSWKVDDRERPLTKEDYEKLSADAAYVPYHSSQFYVLNANGVLVDVIGYGSEPDAIAETLRPYLSAP